MPVIAHVHRLIPSCVSSYCFFLPNSSTLRAEYHRKHRQHSKIPLFNHIKLQNKISEMPGEGSLTSRWAQSLYVCVCVYSCQCVFGSTRQLPLAAAVIFTKVIDEAGAHHRKRGAVTAVPGSHRFLSAGQLGEAAYQSEIK